jgi:ankyrin repeat protein
MVLSGTAPDICGHETAYKHGYLTLVVAGRRQIHPKAFIDSKHAETARFLIQSGAPTEQQDIALYTPLQHATVHEGPQLDVARVLLENGANPNNQNKVRTKPLLFTINSNLASLLLYYLCSAVAPH